MSHATMDIGPVAKGFLWGVACIAYSVLSYLVGVAGLGVLILATLEIVPLGWFRLAGSSMSAVLVDIGLLLLFGAQHSLMARPGFKRLLGRILPPALERSTYVWTSGIELRGPEVKSLRAGRANLGDAFAQIHRGEVWLEKLHIPPYEPATRDNPTDPQRRRKLLLHRSEIARLDGRVAEKGLTLVPLTLYFRRGRAKVELALARGKQRHDKRESIKRREADRETQRVMRRHQR